MLISLIAFFTNAFAFDINIEKYKKEKFWQAPPVVVVCDNAPVTVDQVKIAVKAWQDKGVNFGEVRKQHAGECQKKWSYHETGDILITNDMRFLDKDENNGWTVKYTYPENRSLIVSAICEISPKKLKAQPNYAHKLLVHEIGHALGYSHSHFSKNDVMQPSLTHVN